MDVIKATGRYEAWLRTVLPFDVYEPDLDHKHRLMSDPLDPFPFFRGTYYRWAQLWAGTAGPLAAAPRVLSVGDLHVENYGTWRDADGRLCWGVNDFDEADDLPYTNDLVRLAVSARFARKGDVLNVKLGRACEVILDGYRECLTAGGGGFVLEERHSHLRRMALSADREPSSVWQKLSSLEVNPPVEPPAEVCAELGASLPAGVTNVGYRRRPKAGVGSLGRARYIALANWAGGWVCREAKAAAPPATAWATDTAGKPRSAEALAATTRPADPFYRPGPRWIVRRLGPHVSRIELGDLVRAEAERVLRAMGAEVANVHVTSRVAILNDLGGRPADWLEKAARSMFDVVEQDWIAWRAGHAGT
ncbi:DUF2252 family protein [Limnoglobus roseus]|uniref:DUF2252 domain-containing protein n=1 Tax=Limnoglobus roseus TaxID=2598579 RepID=A0A5C1AFR0_9BACT|nr:DUF2252 family protein [Limnoglobus roseus]QEL16572.1 hypothetical protein PX52LOC_03532 [Limnoglobus roseus]